MVCKLPSLSPSTSVALSLQSPNLSSLTRVKEPGKQFSHVQSHFRECAAWTKFPSSSFKGKKGKKWPKEAPPCLLPTSWPGRTRKMSNKTTNFSDECCPLQWVTPSKFHRTIHGEQGSTHASLPPVFPADRERRYMVISESSFCPLALLQLQGESQPQA